MLAITTRATRPTPNHASCRRAAPPARPTLRFNSVTKLVRTSAVAAPSRAQSTFSSSLRSIRIMSRVVAVGALSRPPSGRAHRSSLQVYAGDALEENGVEDLPRDRRGDLPALAAALGEHHDDDLGILDRRERREPGVILSEGRLRLRDRLRRAGLAGDIEARDTRAAARAAVVDHGPQGVAEERPDDRRELHVAVHLARVAPEHALPGTLDPLDEPRPPEHAAVRHRAHEAGDLHRRDEERALADRHVHGLPP